MIFDYLTRPAPWDPMQMETIAIGYTFMTQAEEDELLKLYNNPALGHNQKIHAFCNFLTQRPSQTETGVIIKIFESLRNGTFVRRNEYSKILSSAIRGNQFNRTGAHNVMEFLGHTKDDKVDDYVFRDGARVKNTRMKIKVKRMKTKRKNNRNGKKY